MLTRVRCAQKPPSATEERARRREQLKAEQELAQLQEVRRRQRQIGKGQGISQRISQALAASSPAAHASISRSSSSSSTPADACERAPQRLNCTSSVSPAATATAQLSSDSPTSLLERLTQLPPPVCIPPNSIHLTYLHGFLSDAECEHLLSLCVGLFHRSSTYGGISPVRTSYSASLYSSVSVVAAVRSRVSLLTSAKDAQIQELSVVRYTEGQTYMPHFDSSRAFDRPLRRYTLFVYLNSLAEGEGGETHFPELNVRFRPQRGDALWWENHASATSEHHDQSRHAGLPPKGAAIKYGKFVAAPQWLHLSVSEVPRRLAEG